MLNSKEHYKQLKAVHDLMIVCRRFVYESRYNAKIVDFLNDLGHMQTLILDMDNTTACFKENLKAICIKHNCRYIVNWYLNINKKEIKQVKDRPKGLTLWLILLFLSLLLYEIFNS
jgi:hypothetical protein